MIIPNRRTILVILTLVTLLGFVIGEVFILVVGKAMLAPYRGDMPPPPPHANEVSFKDSATDGQIAAWHYPQPTQSEPHRGAVLLVHGIRANRLVMLQRANWLVDHGFTVLAIDLQAHGTSTGDRITLGRLESDNVRAGVAWLRTQIPQNTPVTVIGISLGGASALIGEGCGADAVVSEAAFGDIETALSNRLAHHLGGRWGRIFTPLLSWNLPLICGSQTSNLSPIEGAAYLNIPLLVMNGSADVHATPEEAKAIHSAAPNGKATLVIFEGATHADLYQFDPARYEKVVLEFLDTVEVNR